MRILTICILLCFNFCTTGQSLKDTINLLEQKAHTYFTKMYVERKIDSAALMWDSTTFSEMKEAYKKKGIIITNDSILFEKLKSDILSFFKTIQLFQVTGLFGYHKAEDDPNLKTISLGFNYIDNNGRKPKQKKILLYFISKDQGSTWKIQDFMVKEIISKK